MNKITKNNIIEEEIIKTKRDLKLERSILLDFFDIKILLFIFLIILIFDIKDDLWKVKNVILKKFKKNNTMIPSTILLFVILIGYFVWLNLYNKKKKIYEIQKVKGGIDEKDKKVFERETLKIKSYRNALIVGLSALSIALLLIINRLLPVFLFNFIIAFYFGVSSF